MIVQIVMHGVASFGTAMRLCMYSTWYHRGVLTG